jgi:hypothetical protein
MPVTFNDPTADQTAATRISSGRAPSSWCQAGSWAGNRGSAKFSVVALDTRANRSRASASRCAAASARSYDEARLVGGFYGYDNRTDVKDPAACAGSTGARPARLRGSLDAPAGRG